MQRQHSPCQTVFWKTSFVFSKHQFIWAYHLLTELKHPNLSCATTHRYLALFTAFFHTCLEPRHPLRIILRVPSQQCDQCRKSNLFVGSSTRNLCHQDKLSIKFFIGKSLKDSGKGWHVCDQALHALGCCTTTTPHVTQQSPSMNFWQKKAFLWFLSPHIRQSQSL
jgi:hypothetical protein